MNKSLRKVVAGVLTAVVALAVLSGCQAQETDDQTVATQEKLKIARQYGLAYAPLTIMEEMKLIEKHAPDLSVEWVQLGNTAAIREAILTDELDIGFMGIPPYLIGVENGMEWEIFTGLSRAPLGLMTNQDDINAISDINEDDRIALPQPGSIQHILLTMAAKRELGDAKAFDSQLVSLKHPDGVQMLVANSDITMHFTSPPFVFQEKEEGMKEVISGDEAFGGPFTFIVGTLREEMTESEETVNAVKAALKESMSFMVDNREKTVEILSGAYGIDAEILDTYLYESGIEYSEEILGLDTFVDFMVEETYLSPGIEDKTLLWSE